ncbi:MAG: hypothetical protein Q7T78_17180 [Rhodoferax sp.]|nr:hypothetical protein [Rhodoferax sp.]
MDESIRPKTPQEQEADRIAADLANNENKTQRAHQAQERNALRLQMNDKTGFFA